jgi:elastase-2
MHEEYEMGNASFSNDIAIIHFANNGISEAGNIAYATLPADNSEDFDDQTCVISGWGRTDATNALPLIFQKATIGVIDTAECNIRVAPVGASVWDSQICLYNPAEDIGSCNGDSGGPLNCGPARDIVAGITSWGVAGSINNRCLPDYPSVYTRTSAYLAWIAAN